jgi:hypothetical protein
MRRVVGILLMLIAVFALVAGAALALALGPDNRAETGPHEIATDAPVVVTDPDVLGWAGPTITVSVGVADERQVFVGAANAVDVADYVQLTARTEVTDYGVPWDVSTRDVDGTGTLPAPPSELDWWVAQDDGPGQASLSVKLPEQAFALVVVSVGGGSLEGLEVTASYDVDGGFGIGLGLVGFAVGLGLFGWIAFQGRPMTRTGERADEEAAGEETAGDDAPGEETDPAPDDSDDADRADDSDDDMPDEARPEKQPEST